MNNSFAKEIIANIQSQIGLKQSLIMAMDCTTSSQCSIVTEFYVMSMKMRVTDNWKALKECKLPPPLSVSCSF